MRKVLLLIGLMLSINYLQAQYTGGEGGGYASAALILNVQSGPSVIFGENTLQTNEVFEVRIVELTRKFEWKLFDIQGKIIGQDERFLIAPEIKLEIPMPESAGIYLFQLMVDGRMYHQKIRVIDP